MKAASALERSTDGKNFTTLATFSKHNAAFSDVTVSAGVPFWYRVIALGGGGKESAPSNIAGVTTLSTPRNFAVSNASTSQVGLIWDKVSTALNYQVQRFDGTTWTPLVKLGKTTLAFVDTTSASGTDYSYRVGATSANGSSSYATLQLTTPMEVPSVTADSSVAGQVTITWDSVNGAIGGYEVDRKAAGQVFGQLAIVKDATEYQDLAVTEDADYEYQVIAIGSADSSSASDVVQTHTAVAAPTDCAAQVLSGSQVNVRWTHALADSYISIEGSIDGGQTWDVMIMVPGDFSQIVVTTKGSKTYQFRLQTRAFDGLNSGYAEIHDVVTPLASPAISALATDSGVTISWDDAGDDAGYVIQRAVGDGDFEPLAQVETDITQYFDADVSAGVTYHYQVASIAENQTQTEWSNDVPVTAYVAAPIGLTIDDTTPTSISFHWTIQTSNVANYALLYEDGVHGQATVLLPSDATSYTLDTLELSRSYQFQIQSLDANGVAISDQSNSVAYATPEGPNDLSALRKHSAVGNLPDLGGPIRRHQGVCD